MKDNLFRKEQFKDIMWGKFAYCFGCQAFRTNMQGLDKCPDCQSKELIFSE